MSWADHLRWLFIHWYVLSGISFVFMLMVNFWLTTLDLGGEIDLFGFFYFENLPVLLWDVVVWPFGYIYMLTEIITIFLGDHSFFVPNNPSIAIFSFILFLIVPFIGYLITYILSYRRIPWSKEDLVLPFNRDLFLGNTVVWDNGKIESQNDDKG